MKKLFTIASTVLLILTVCSSCKKEETVLSNAQLTENILKYKVYRGAMYINDKKHDDVTVTFTTVDNTLYFGLIEDMNLPVATEPTADDMLAIGYWVVQDGSIKLIRTLMYGDEDHGFYLEGKVSEEGKVMNLTYSDTYGKENYKVDIKALQ